MRDIYDPLVLQAVEKVKRHLFVPESLQHMAYDDTPLPIGYDQTISQPYLVAFMTQAARLNRSDRVLEIGTGSGYQTALLAEIAREVYTVEMIEPLATEAARRLKKLGYQNISVKCGDGYEGWAEHAPYDAVIVTAAPTELPSKLAEQLAVRGKLIIPLGPSDNQKLYRFVKTPKGLLEEEIFAVSFVPMVRASAEA